MNTVPHNPLVFLVPFLVSFLFTPLIRAFALRYHLVALPKEDRWHKKPVALFGGIAIYCATVAAILIFIPKQQDVIAFLVGGTFIFLWGLIDDIRHISPQAKLLGQVVAVSIAMFLGVKVTLVPVDLVAIVITIIWVVGITNAFNMLDNMDGLSVGIAGICSLAFGIFSILLKNPLVATISFIIAASCFGFLPYNFYPARIFMGDSGSMFLGFSLALASIMGTWMEVSNLFIILMLPLLLFIVPIFDTTFVTVARKLNGRAISQGGKDHTSHRLVYIGISERRAVLIFYTVAALFVVIGLIGIRFNMYVASLLTSLAFIFIFLLGLFLGQVPVYQKGTVAAAGKEAMEKETGFFINTLILYKRQIAEVLIDSCLIVISYVGAYLVYFNGQLGGDARALIVESLPIVISIKLICFFHFRLYSGLWRYISIYDFIAIAKAVVTSSILCVAALLFLFRFKDYPRAVFLMDAENLILLLIGARVMLRVFKEHIFAIRDKKAHRVLIVGAGDAGELVLREINNNPRLKRKVAGFIDDDVSKHKKRIHGVKVLGSRNAIVTLAEKMSINEVIIAIPSLAPQEKDKIVALCEAAQVSYQEIGALLS